MNFRTTILGAKWRGLQSGRPVKNCMFVQIKGPGWGLSLSQANWNPFPENLDLGERELHFYSWLDLPWKFESGVKFYLSNGLSCRKKQFAEKYVCCLERSQVKIQRDSDLSKISCRVSLVELGFFLSVTHYFMLFPL